MDVKELGESIDKKFNEVKADFTKLKEQVEASEKAQKDIFKLDETKAVLQTQLAELLQVAEGEKKTALVEYAKNMQAQLNILEGKISEQAETGKNKVKSAEAQILEFLTKDSTKQMIAAKKSNPDMKMGNGLDFEVKTITTADLTAIGTNSIALGLTAPLEAGVNKAPNNPILFYQLVQKGTVSKEYIAWTERTSVTRGADMRAENNEFPTSSFTLNEAKADVKKIADSISVSNEMLEDVDYAMSEIMDLLQNNIPKKRDAQLYNGTGLTTNLTGITATGQAKTFAVPAGVDTMAAPDSYMVLAAAILQCMLGNSETDIEDIGFAPNGITINPATFFNMQMLVDKDGKFLYPQLWMPNPNIAGVPIYTTTRVAADAFLVGDFTMAKYFTRRGLNIRMWDQNGTDPMYDRVTFTASERGVLRIKAHDKFAFVKGTFTAAKALLQAQA